MRYFDAIEHIRCLVRGEDVYNDEFFKYLLRSECLYLLSKSKQSATKVALPISVNSIICNNRYQICKNVMHALREIPYANIKGAILSSRIYENPAFRLSGDIDLLVSPDNSARVKEILTRNDFVQGRLTGNQIVPYTREELIYQKSFTHQLAPFVKYTGNKACPFVSIDVNLGVVWGEALFSIDMNEFLTHTQHFEIFGVTISRLQPIWEFIALCMHHYKDMNSIFLIAEHGLKLSEYCDIYFYLVNVKPNAARLASVSKQYGLDKYVYYCIYYANEIFNDPSLIEYLNELDSKEAQALLNCYGLSPEERHEWRVSFFDRLFNNKFKFDFYSSLSEKAKNKIKLNRDFM